MNPKDAQHLIPTALAPADMSREERNEARLVRIETRLVMLMRHCGLDANGKPLAVTPVEEPTT